MKTRHLLTVICVAVCAVMISSSMTSLSPVIKIVTGIIGVILFPFTLQEEIS